MCSLLGGMWCYCIVIYLAYDKDLFKRLSSILFLLLVVLGTYFGGIFGALIGGALFGVGRALIDDDIGHLTLLERLKSYFLLCAIERTIKICNSSRRLGKLKIH